jgi:hypothetical protein
MKRMRLFGAGTACGELQRAPFCCDHEIQEMDGMDGMDGMKGRWLAAARRGPRWSRWSCALSSARGRTGTQRLLLSGC